MSQFFLQIILFLYYTVAFENLGIAIIEIAVLARILLYPVLKQQIKHSQNMMKLQPHLSKIKKKYKDNQQAQAKAQMELFKKHGINPAAGCLPQIVQIIVLIGLFGALNDILKSDLNTRFLIWDLARPDVPFKDILFFPGMNIDIPGLIKIDNFLRFNLSIPGILVFGAAFTQIVYSQMMMPIYHYKDKKNKQSGFEDEMIQSQQRMFWMFPLMFLFFGSMWPSGLALYWTVSSIISIFFQYKISGWGNLEKLFEKIRNIRDR